MFEIKAGAVNHLTDARYFSAKGVQWMGFDFEEGQPDAIMRYQAIKEWIAGPQFVGEFASYAEASVIASVAQQLGLKAVQMSPFHTTDDIIKVAQTTDVWLTVPMAMYTEAQLRQRLYACHHAITSLVLIPDHNNIPTLHIALLAAQYAVWVRPEHADQARELLLIPGLRGFELLGSTEEKTGYNSFDDLDEIFDLLPDAFA